MSDALFKFIKTIVKPLIPFQLGVKLRGGWQKLMAWFYHGNKYYCPYCKHTFRKMLPAGERPPINIEKKIIGAGYRQNVLCPRCYSTDRDRLIWIWLQEYTNLGIDEKVLLHIAPEGSIRAYLKKIQGIEYHMGDKFEEGYDQYYYDRAVEQMDILELPYNDDVFDLIICNHVLEHIDNDYKAMGELYRVLKPGGKAVLQVPISWIIEETYEDASKTTHKEREDAFGQYDHVRIYGPDYPKRLENAGFEVEIIDPNQKDWMENYKDYSLNPDEKIFIAHKK